MSAIHDAFDPMPYHLRPTPRGLAEGEQRLDDAEYHAIMDDHAARVLQNPNGFEHSELVSAQAWATAFFRRRPE